MDGSSKYRVFMSYSHKELHFAKQVETILRKLGLDVMWDQKFSIGTGFNEQIQTFISYSHIFLPIITKSSSSREWVHQEIGYAISQNIPILPLAIDKRPDAMMQGLQALVLPADLLGVEDMITFDMFDHLIRRYRDGKYASYQCTRFTEERSRMIAKYANEILLLGHKGMIRQKGGLSSFHIPTEVITDGIWEERSGKYIQTPIHYQSLQDERLALEKHAQDDGCRLIINPMQEYRVLGPMARIRRLECLVRYLQSDNGKKAEVAIYDGLHSNVNITILGNWMYAESVSAYHGALPFPEVSGKKFFLKPENMPVGEGIWQTIFTRHAPSILDRVELFDKEFLQLLNRSGWSARDSRDRAIAFLSDLIEKLYIEHPNIPGSEYGIN